MKKNGPRVLTLFSLLLFLPLPTLSQQVLTLDSCRAMALRSGKQMGVARLKQDVATNLRKAARTKYLPHVSAIGTYQWTSEEISLLNNSQKSALSNLGTNTSPAVQGLVSNIEGQMTQVATLLGQLGVPTAQLQQMSAQLQQQTTQAMTGTTALLNQEGQKIVDAFRTDTRNIFAGSIMVTQPVYMGGALVALNRLADLNEDLTELSLEARQQNTIYAVDQAYWQVVSLSHKRLLAQSFADLVRKLDGDVQKMIAEGVATRSEGLSVSVRLSMAELTLQKVDDGLRLSRMLLCQKIGLPLDTDIEPADTLSAEIATTALPYPASNLETSARPDLQMLETGVAMSRHTTKIMKAANLPQVALTGGYSVSNPNVLNGFEKKFAGFWNVGLLVRIPIWNWGDNMYKVRASKGATAIASLELEEARELADLQTSQASLRVEEAQRRLTLATTSIERANENLRTAQLGFSEGVITPTTVMEAQTAWLQARSQLIDAEIEQRLATIDLQKALGKLKADF